MTIDFELLVIAAVVFPITLIILWGTRSRPDPQAEENEGL